MLDFEFEGFVPTQKVKSYAKEVLWNLENQAPSQAQPFAFIKQNSKGDYQGNISFTSRQITLSAEAKDSDPYKVIENLSFQLKSDIKKWRESRFKSA